MSLKIDRVQLEIVIQQDTARQKLLQVEGDMKKVRKELRGLKEGTQEWADKKDELLKLQQQYDALFDEIGIGSLSVKELRNRQKELNTVLSQLPGNSPLYNQYKQQVDQINLRLKELKGTATETKFSLSKLADGFNKYAGVIAGAVASLTGVTLAARKCVDDFAKLEEAEANVRKYTGMTREQVKDLNEEFKKMDTRTARTELNDLAADAGRLGITSKQHLLEFAEAGNIIRVSLGDDLGEDAIKNIGKLSQMFGDADKMGLKNAMLAIGSAVNEVAQNSSAAEPYLVNFTARLAGVGNQAKMSVSQIMGFGSVLDQNMQQVEMSSTALQGVIMKMYKNPEKLAKIAGLEVKKFTELVKNDANEALLQLLETLGKKGGMEKLAPIFEEMKLDGARAASVLSVLSGNIKNIRSEQELASQAFNDGTSVVEEYNVKNTTLQATIEKAKKRFQEVSYELGEKLAPHMSKAISTGSLMIKGISATVSILTKYGGLLVTTGVLLGTYLTIQKLNVLWTTRQTEGTLLNVAALKLKDFWTKAVTATTYLYVAAIALSTGATTRATLAMKAFFSVLRLNPIGLITTLITGLGAAYFYLAKKMSDYYNINAVNEKITNKVNEQVQKQKDKIKELTDKIHDNSLSLDARREAILRLRTIMPEYHAQITEEGEVINENTQELEKHNTELSRNIKLREINNELNKRRESVENLKNSPAFKDNSLMGSMARQDVRSKIAQEEAVINSLLESYEQLEGERNKPIDAKPIVRTLEDVNKDLEQANKRLGELTNMTELEKGWLDYDYDSVVNDVKSKIELLKKEKRNLDGDPVTSGGDELEDEKLKKLLKKKEEEYKQVMNQEQNLAKERFMANKLTEEKYNEELFKSEINFLTSKKALLEQYGQDSSEVQGQIYDKMIAESDRLTKAKKNADKKAKDNELKDLDNSYSDDKTALKQLYLNGEIKTEKEFQDKMKELERDYLQSRLGVLQKYGEDTGKITDQIADQELAKLKEQKEKEKAAGEKELTKAVGLDDKLSILQAMYDADLISYEEYEKTKTQITDDERQKREELISSSFQVIAQAAQAAGEIVNALMDREISKITQRYDKQIKAARKAGKDTTKLEEAKEEEINAVKKKYADKQFKAAVLQVTATTAVAAMEAYKAMAGIPIVGPVLGAAAAAAAIASGMAQIQIAKTQQEEAKGLKTGGYSLEYVEGYTTTGNPDDVAGAIPVHKNEFVANHEGVANPHVRQFLDIFDVAQKNGTIRMINTTQILEQVRTRSGRYSGGFTNDDPQPAGFSQQITSGTGTGQQDMQKVVLLLQESNRLLALISEKDLNIDGRVIRDRIRQLDQLEKNVSRKK